MFCENTHEVSIVLKTKFPAIVMMLGVVSNEGISWPLVVLEEFVPWMKQKANGRHFNPQQDFILQQSLRLPQHQCSWILVKGNLATKLTGCNFFGLLCIMYWVLVKAKLLSNIFLILSLLKMSLDKLIKECSRSHVDQIIARNLYFLTI